VRETWQAYDEGVIETRLGRARVFSRRPRLGDTIEYRADKDLSKCFIPWRSPIHMPRWACRLRRTLAKISLARLLDIGEADALAEGVPPCDAGPVDPIWCPTCRGQRVHGAFGRDYGVTEVDCHHCDTAVKRYRNLWEHLNGSGTWDLNKWVWVLDWGAVSASGCHDGIEGGAR